MAKLTEKQAKFVQGKLAGLNGVAAAIAAGYSPAGAKVAAANLAKLPHVKAALRAGKGKVDPAASDLQFGMRDNYESGLALLQHAYNNPKLPLGLRVDCAKQALPYESAKIGETGKKDKAKKRAAEISGGDGDAPADRRGTRQTRPAPLLVAVK